MGAGPTRADSRSTEDRLAASPGKEEEEEALAEAPLCRTVLSLTPHCTSDHRSLHARTTIALAADEGRPFSTAAEDILAARDTTRSSGRSRLSSATPLPLHFPKDLFSFIFFLALSLLFSPPEVGSETMEEERVLCQRYFSCGESETPIRYRLFDKSGIPYICFGKSPTYLLAL